MRVWAHSVAMLLASALILMLETLFFHVLVYINNYLEATAIISVALLGLALGGLLGYYVHRKRMTRWLPFAAVGAGLGIVLSIVNFVYFPRFLAYPLLLGVPFLLLSVIVAVLFADLSKHPAYFCNLSGAALGVILVCLLAPRMKSENAMLTAIALTGFLGALLALTRRRPFWPLAASVVVFAGGCAMVVWNLRTDAFDFGRVTQCSQRASQNVAKTFCLTKRPGIKLRYVRDNLVGRVDILERAGRSALTVCQEGVVSDIVEQRPFSAYDWDCRIPKPLVPDPTILVIGASAEGVTKTARHRSPETVVGVEINPGIVDLMTDELYEYSRRAYEGIELHLTDGRTFLERTDRQFDLITMMNTHTRGRVAENVGLPQYLFTEEAFTLMLERITDRGALLIEEVLVERQTREFVKKIFASIIAGLQNHGVHDDFSKHFYAFTFRNRFFLFIVKKTPFEPAEAEALDDWLAKRWEVRRRKHPKFVHPFRSLDNEFAAFVYNPQSEITTAFAERGLDLGPITDDKPFLYDIDARHPEAWRMLAASCLAACFLVLLPSAILFARAPSRDIRGGLGGLLYFSSIGAAYMLVEIVLMQKYQLYLGSPIYSLLVVLSSILLFSGIGSLVSGWFSARLKKGCLLAVPVLLLAASWGLESVFGYTQGFSFAARISIALASLFPLFFCMGVPFPYGLMLIERRFLPSYIGLVYGVNGAFGTVGVTLSMLISVYFGFSTTFHVGVGLYLLAFVLALSGFGRRVGLPEKPAR